MIYTDVEILAIDFLDYYEGYIRIKLNTEELLVNYQMPFDQAKRHFVPGNKISVDLWLFYGEAKVSLFQYKQALHNTSASGGMLNGQVIEVFNSKEFRIDCGVFEIDVLNEHPIDIAKNEYIKIEGGYYIFLPGTAYNKEDYWG